MFWHCDEFNEDEWSLSAKVLGGLLLNPLASPNKGNPRLVDWFVRYVTGDEALQLAQWSAKPEYQGLLADGSKHDWMLVFDGWHVVIEAKFGREISSRQIMTYLGHLPEPHRRVVVVATWSDLAELTNKSADGDIRSAIESGEVVFLGWHEIINAAIERTSNETDATLLANWAAGVQRDRLTLLPPLGSELLGSEALALLVGKKSAGILPAHKQDARSNRKPTGTIESVLQKSGAPEWIHHCCSNLVESLQERIAEIEPHDDRGCWIDLRAKSGGDTVTIIPVGPPVVRSGLQNGVGIAIHSPEEGWTQSLQGYGLLTSTPFVEPHKTWWPPSKAIGKWFGEKIAPSELAKEVRLALEFMNPSFVFERESDQ